ncbi:hypothetical protein [Natrialba aegyptia]|nr:hypothetical protein [Natrialba aegyptia]
MSEYARDVEVTVRMDAEEAEEIAEQINHGTGIKVCFKLSDEYPDGGKILGEGFACVPEDNEETANADTLYHEGEAKR